MGTIMMTACKQLGLAGVVIDGAVRDSLEIDEMDFPVFSVGTNPNGPTKHVPGRIGHPVIGRRRHACTPATSSSATPTAWSWSSASKIESLLPLAAKKVADETERIAADQGAARPARPWLAARCAPPACSRKGRRCEHEKPAILVTGADLAPQALALLQDFEIVYAGKTPQEPDLVALCKRHDPVAIIVRYGKVGAAVMDAAPVAAR